MNPALSVVFFTVLAGFGQGLAVALALAVLAGALATGSPFLSLALALAIVLMVAGLASSFLHLGHPMRAWRAAAMWRTSWLSREVIVMPAFIGWLVLWWLAGATRLAPGVVSGVVLPAGTIVLAAALWFCTAKIYSCMRFIREWAHPLTLWYYVLTGLASGVVLAGCIAALRGEPALLRIAGSIGWGVALVAAATRLATLRRNARLQPVSTLQSATGIPAARVRQVSMGMSAGSFNTREFFHGRTAATIAHVKRTAVGAGFLLPLALLAVAAAAGAPAWVWPLALASQAAGLLADRWLFFAQARHPQSLYYQTVA